MRSVLWVSALALAAACAAPEPLAPVSAAPPPPTAPPPSVSQVCRGPAAVMADASADASDDPSAESMGPETVESPSSPSLTCELADANLSAAEDAVLAASPGVPASARSAPWDHKRPLEYMRLVDGRFHLSADERRLLTRQGFVVSPDRRQSTFAWAFHDLYQSQVPLYVSVDAIFHAVYASNDGLVKALEQARLAPLLGRTLDAMSCALADAAPSYPPEVARDLDVYLTVARSLLADRELPGALGVDAQVGKLLEMARRPAALERVRLFGRDRSVDFGAYAPRGHYSGDLAPFFRAATWLSRLELNLVSRSCRSSHPEVTVDPSETPEEGAVALALADVAERAHVVAATDLLDHAWGLLAGKREDISVSEIGRLRRQAGIGAVTLEATGALRAAIGDRYQRRARIHAMPEGATVLPAITTFLGPRIVPDTTATRPLVHDAVAGRQMLHAADMAYALGQDRAKAYLAGDLAAYPGLDRALGAARAILSEPLPEGDLYSAWFGAIRALRLPDRGAIPSFMTTDAFADLRVGSVVAAYGQLRHSYVLIAGQGYGVAGCEIPDAYLEPAPEAFRGLVDYAERGARVVAELDPDDATHARAYFARLRKTLRVLAVIAEGELAGRPLTAAERRFLSMVAEYSPPATGKGPTYTGWYFDMFRRREAEGLSNASFVADYYTSGEAGKVAYAGAGEPEMGFFVVDTGGAPRVMVGPVASAYEHTGPLSARLNDDAARELPTTERLAPWAASYTASPVGEPPLFISEVLTGFASLEPGVFPPVRLRVGSTRKLGPVTIEILDHHRLPLASRTRIVGPEATTFTYPPQRVSPGDELPDIEGVHVKVGAFERVVTVGVTAMGPDPISVGLGGMTPPPDAP